METGGGGGVAGSPGEPGHQTSQRVASTDMMYSHQSHLLKQLDEQRRQELFCDCHVLVEGRLFKAHRNVLFGCSGYFRMLLSHGASECGRIVTASFEAFNSDTFSLILDFVYSGRIRLTSTNVIEVMSAASYLQMNDVISFCKSFIASRLDISPKDEGEEEEDEDEDGTGNTSSPDHQHLLESEPEVPPSALALPSCGRRRTLKTEAEVESVSPGKKKAWSSLVSNSTHLELQVASPSSAQKAEDLYSTLPDVMGVVGVFSKGSSHGTRFKCPFCAHTVKRRADLKRHLRCHTGERPYPCEACNKRFTRLEHMRSHFETIHQASKLVCRKCKRSVTELSGRVVCEGTRRYRLCNDCLPESSCDALLLQSVDTEADGQGQMDTEADWLGTDDDELAVDSGTDLIIQEVDDSEEEQN